LIEHDDLLNQVEKVYEFVKRERINVHLGFDVKEYLPTENYKEKGAKLNLLFKLEE